MALWLPSPYGVRPYFLKVLTLAKEFEHLDVSALPWRPFPDFIWFPVDFVGEERSEYYRAHGLHGLQAPGLPTRWLALGRFGNDSTIGCLELRPGEAGSLLVQAGLGHLLPPELSDDPEFRTPRSAVPDILALPREATGTPPALGLPIVLNGEDEEPTVWGIQKPRLTPGQYRVVKALLDAHPKRPDGETLARRSETEDPVGMIDRLIRDADWRDALDKPGKAHGGYGIKLKRPTKAPTKSRKATSKPLKRTPRKG
jgi:hypothetical protein